MNKILILLILLGYIQLPVFAFEYNTLSVSNFQNDYMKNKIPRVELLQYDDKAELPYGSEVYDAGSGYKLITRKGYPYSIEVLKFRDNRLLWVKSFDIYCANFKSAYPDKQDNLVIELENYSKDDVFDYINNKGKAFDTRGYYHLTKKDFTINTDGSIISELEGLPNKYNQFLYCDSFDYNGKNYYIVAEQAYYIGEVISWINYYLFVFGDENDKRALKDVKYLFSQKNINDINIDFSDKVNITFGNKKMILKDDKLYFNNLESFLAHLYGSIRHVIAICDVKRQLSTYKIKTINNQSEGSYSKLIGQLAKIQKSDGNTILATKSIGGRKCYNSVIRIDEHNKMFIKTLDDYKLARDIDRIIYKKGVYNITLKETPEYDTNFYLNSVINVKEDGTIINPLKIIKVRNYNRDSIKRFKKDGHSFVMISGQLYLLKGSELYSTELSYKEGKQEVKIIDNENYYLKYPQSERVIKEYNFYNNGYNPEKERECDFKLSNGFKFWIKHTSLLRRDMESNKTYHLGSLFPMDVQIPEDFKIKDINVLNNDSVVEINTSLGKVIFIPDEEKIISPEIIVKKKLVKIDTPVSVVKKFWNDSGLNTDKEIYYFNQASNIN